MLRIVDSRERRVGLDLNRQKEVQKTLQRVVFIECKVVEAGNILLNSAGDVNCGSEPLPCFVCRYARRDKAETRGTELHVENGSIIVRNTVRRTVSRQEPYRILMRREAGGEARE